MLRMRNKRQRRACRKGEQRQAPEHDRVRSDHDVHERRAKRAIETGQRPHREQSRCDEDQRTTSSPRDGELWPQRRKRACLRSSRLPHHHNSETLQRKDGDQHEVDQVRGLGQELHEQSGSKRPTRGARYRADAVRDGALRPVDVEQAGAKRTDRGTRRKALDDSGDEQRAHAARGREDDQRGNLDHDRREQHRSASDVVRQRPDRQQRAENGQRVHAEDDGDGDRREAPLSSGRRDTAASARSMPRATRPASTPAGRTRPSSAACGSRRGGRDASVEAAAALGVVVLGAAVAGLW